MTLKQDIKYQARRLGFLLTGVTTPDAPSHVSTYQQWLQDGHHGEMHYLATERAQICRANPRLILPNCQSIFVLAIPYSKPNSFSSNNSPNPEGCVAAYAWGDDYHDVIIPKLKELVAFIKKQTGTTIPNRYYTDTGPVLERDLAQRAGLGWIGKNSCLINPKSGSYFLLAEILLGIALDPDPPISTDHCGTCTRCIQACPTGCILPNRTIDAQRCISYLTIELKGEIPKELRPLIGNHIFGCDACQTVCPWNRFATQEIDASFAPRPELPSPNLIQELSLTPEEFSRKFKGNPIKRAKRRGYLRNISIALGNSENPDARPALEKAIEDPEPLIREHVAWALDHIQGNEDEIQT